MNAIVVEYGGIKIQNDGIDIRITYNEIIKMNTNNKNNVFGFDKQTLNMLKEFACYMTERLKDIDVDSENL